MKLFKGSKALCSLRWDYYVYDVARDRLRTCCRTLSSAGKSYADDWSHSINQRALMLQNERPEDCSICWKLEDAGAKSFRVLSDKFIENLTAAPDPHTLDKPKTLELILGTTCDLKCKYCGPHSSSRWQKELGQPVQNFHFTNQVRDRFISRLNNWWPELRYINFIGGEPLLHESFYTIFDLLQEKEAHPEGRTVRVVTNLNATKQRLDRFLDCVRASRNPVSIYISNEAIGQLAEAIRVGLNFERFNQNLESLLTQTQHPHQIRFIVTLNRDCLPGLPDFFMYLQTKMEKFDRAIYLQWNIVVEPSELSPLRVPTEVKQAINACRPLFDRLLKSSRCSDSLKKNWMNYWANFESLASL